MADAAAKAKVHKLIESKVRPLANEGLKLHQETVPKWNKAADKIRALEGWEAADTVKMYMRSLTIEARKFISVRQPLRNATHALDDVTSNDDDYEADKDEIEKLKAELTSALTFIEFVLGQTKILEDKAQAHIDKVEKSEIKARADWASIVLTQERRLYLVDKHLKEFQVWDKDAQAAVKSRDAKRLKRLQDSVPKVDLPDDILKGNMTMAHREKFQKLFDIKTMTTEFQAEVGRDLHKLNRFDMDAQKGAQECKKIRDDGAKLVVEPPDLKKAMSVLSLPSKGESKLKAALGLDEGPMIKALDALAKELKLKDTGKDMVKKLKDRGVL